MRNLVICLAIAIFIVSFCNIFFVGPSSSGGTMLLCLLLFALLGVKLLKTILGPSNEKDSNDDKE